MGQAFLYGNGSGGSGGTLTVTAPAGVTVTISKDDKVKTKVADSSGVAIFKGLKSGTWTVTISDGSDTATAAVEIVADYTKAMTFFAATIAVTYPAGAIVTCSDGQTMLTAPDTSGSYIFTVPNAGAWTVTCTKDGKSNTKTVTITTDGEGKSVGLSYWDGVLYDSGAFYQDHTEKVEPSSAAITLESDSIKMVTVGSKACELYTVFGPYDLTGFDELEFTGNVVQLIYGAQNIYFCGFVSTKEDAGRADAAAKVETDTQPSDVQTFTLDIPSSLWGSEYYVHVGINTAGGTWLQPRNAYIRSAKLISKG